MSHRTLLVVIAVAAALQGGYMLFDGLHAFVTGRYFGGTVGPWAHVVAAVGITPNELAPVFAVLGAAWLAALGAFLYRVRGAAGALAVVAVLSLWYVPAGTVLSLVVLAMLALRRSRAAMRE